MHVDDSDGPRDGPDRWLNEDAWLDDGRFALLASLGWVEVREVGVPGAWIATDSPVPVEE